MYPAPPKICTASVVTFMAMSLAKHFAIDALAENDLNAASVRQGLYVMPLFRKTELSDAELDAIAAYLTRKR